MDELDLDAIEARWAWARGPGRIIAGKMAAQDIDALIAHARDLRAEVERLREEREDLRLGFAEASESRTQWMNEVNRMRPVVEAARGLRSVLVHNTHADTLEAAEEVERG